MKSKGKAVFAVRAAPSCIICLRSQSLDELLHRKPKALFRFEAGVSGLECAPA